MLHIQPPDEVDYPTSDGEPMGETDLHRDLMQDLKPRFQVYRLEGDLFVRVLAPENTGYVSQTTGLQFRVINDKLRIFIAEGGRILPTASEHAARADREAARADALEREMAALRADPAP